MSSPESLAGGHTSSDIARRGQLWVPAAVTETTGRRLPSEASPSGGGGEAGDKNKEREFRQGPAGPGAKMFPRGAGRGTGMEAKQPPRGVPARPEEEPGLLGRRRAGSTLGPPEPRCPGTHLRTGRPLPLVQRSPAPGGWGASGSGVPVSVRGVGPGHPRGCELC